MKPIQIKLLTAVALAGLAFTSPALQAQSVYTAGHGDLGIEYTPGETEFEAHWHLGTGAMVDGSPLEEEGEFEPDAIIGGLSTTVAAPGTVAGALNVSAGTTVWQTGNTANPPNVGFALEEIGSPDDWLNGTVTLTLSGWSGPGEVALSQTVSGIGSWVWFSTYNPGSTTQNNNSWEFGVGGHQHLDWFFSEAGLYELEFTWTGTYIGLGAEPGGTPVEGSGAFGFQAVPEPGAYALVGGGLALIALLRKRRRA